MTTKSLHIYFPSLRGKIKGKTIGRTPAVFIPSSLWINSMKINGISSRDIYHPKYTGIHPFPFIKDKPIHNTNGTENRENQGFPNGEMENLHTQLAGVA